MGRSGANYVAATLPDAKGDLLTATADNTPARLAVGANGQVLVADSSTSTGLAYAARNVDSLTTGEFVPGNRLLVGSSSIAATSGTLVLAYFTADKTETIATLTAFTGTTAAAATPTLCRYGVYSVAANGDLTLIASTPNDTTLWAATQTAYPKALSASWSKVAGTRYALALLQVTSATAATFSGCQLSATSAMNTIVRYAPAVVGRVTSQTDLTSPISAGSIIGYQGIVAMLLS